MYIDIIMNFDVLKEDNPISRPWHCTYPYNWVGKPMSENKSIMVGHSKEGDTKVICNVMHFSLFAAYVAN